MRYLSHEKLCSFLRSWVPGLEVLEQGLEQGPEQGPEQGQEQGQEQEQEQEREEDMSTTTAAGGVITRSVTVSTVLTSDQLPTTVAVDSTAGAVTITLPDAGLVQGQVVTVDWVAGINPVTVAAAGGQTVDGLASRPVLNTRQSLTVRSRGGTNWAVESGGTPPSMIFIYRGNAAAANQRDNTYTSWAALYAAFNLIPIGPGRIIQFYDDTGAGLTIPAGTYNLYGATLVDTTDAGFGGGISFAAETTIPDGQLFFEIIDCQIFHNNNVAPVYTGTPNRVLRIAGDSEVFFPNAGQPFLSFTGGTGHVYLEGRARIRGNGGIKGINTAGAGTLTFELFGNRPTGTALMADAINHGAGGTVNIQRNSPAALISGIDDTNTAAITGTFSLAQWAQATTLNTLVGTRSTPQNQGSIASGGKVPVSKVLSSGGLGNGNMDWDSIAFVGIRGDPSGRVIPNNSTGTLQAEGMLGPIVAGALASMAFDTNGLNALFTTGAVAGNEAGWNTQAGICTRQSRPYIAVRWTIAQTTAERLFIGLSTEFDAGGVNRPNSTASDTPAGSYIGLQFFTTRGDTNWQFVTRTGGVETLTNTGIAADASVFHMIVDIRAGTNPTFILLNSALSEQFRATVSTNLVANTTVLGLLFSLTTTAAAAKTVRHLNGSMGSLGYSA